LGLNIHSRIKGEEECRSSSTTIFMGVKFINFIVEKIC